jgi:hypothetical protein
MDEDRLLALHAQLAPTQLARLAAFQRQGGSLLLGTQAALPALPFALAVVTALRLVEAPEVPEPS